MKHFYYTIYICVFPFLFFGCSNSENKSAAQVELGSIPEAIYMRLIKECDYVDIIFFDSPVSMSQEDAPGIQRTLSYITKQVAKPDPACRPMGRITYIIQGEIIAEGDVFCADGCTYILFMEDKKPKYANVLSPGGIQFFQNILLQIQNQVKGQ